VKRGKEWGRCHLCREEENGEDATCAGRKRMRKMPHVQERRKWGSCHLCREEKNWEDATCARRKRMGKMPHVQGGKERGRCHMCREEENGEDATCACRKIRVLLKGRERQRWRANIEQRLVPDQLGYNM
jgi:hypothetical protein